MTSVLPRSLAAADDGRTGTTGFAAATVPYGGAALICFALASIALYLRAPDTLWNPQFMAEDGSVFFIGQFGRFLPQLFAPHQGYLVVLPRLVAWIGSAFPATYAPAAYAVASNLVAAGAISYFCFRARAIFHPCASFGTILLAPMLNGELFGMVANLQWFCQLAIVAAALLPVPPGWAKGSAWMRTAELVAIAILALTGPFAILCGFVYLLLVVARWISGRLRMRRTFVSFSRYLDSLDDPSTLIVTVAGLIVMLVVAAQHAVPLHQAGFAAEFFRGASAEGLQVHLLGEIRMTQTAFLVAQGILLAAVLAWEGVPNARIACLVVLGYGLLCLLAGYLKMRAVAMAIPHINFIDRYEFALVVFEWLVVWRVVTVLAGRRELSTACLLVAALALEGFNNPQRIYRAAPPDLDWQAYARRIDAGEEVTAPISPPGWTIHVPARGARN